MIAAAFDDVTGFIIGRIGQPTFTGELTVRYVGPTPIETPVLMTARLDGQERRKLFISGEATVDGVVTATCKAIYITIDPSVFASAPDPRSAPSALGSVERFARDGEVVLVALGTVAPGALVETGLVPRVVVHAVRALRVRGEVRRACAARWRR